ncbi:MAG: DUF4244 domain-containing protein [Acidimicrobiia bacterium]|nr:DUF4244 domain-containing protein [Acidimicrobiia bacterium]
MPHRLLCICVDLYQNLFSNAARLNGGAGSESGTTGERGQTTAEYAMVIIAAAAIAALLLAWATKTDAISRLLDRVIELILPG